MFDTLPSCSYSGSLIANTLETLLNYEVNNPVFQSDGIVLSSIW